MILLSWTHAKCRHVLRAAAGVCFGVVYRVRGMEVPGDQLGLASALHLVIKSVTKMVKFSMISWYAVLFGSMRAQCMTLLPCREGKIGAPSNDSAHGVS